MRIASPDLASAHVLRSDRARRLDRLVADQLREKFQKLAALMDDAETDVLAFMNFPKAHRTQISSTNPLERLNAEIKRRTNVVGIFPNEPAIVRLVGALLLEQNDEWQLQRRYMPLEGSHTLSDNSQVCLPAVAQSASSQPAEDGLLTPRRKTRPTTAGSTLHFEWSFGNIRDEATDWISVTFSIEVIRVGIPIVADHPCFPHNSWFLAPASDSFRIPMICSSVRPPPATDHSRRNSTIYGSRVGSIGLQSRVNKINDLQSSFRSVNRFRVMLSSPRSFLPENSLSKWIVL